MVFYLILILAIILRFISLENIALGDEFYSLYVAKSAYFSSIFSDAGNPFFYYLIIKLEYLIFHFNTLGFKLTSIGFNIASIIFLWLILKKNFNLKTANLSAFLAAINLIMIYYSHEIRCYSFLMMLSPVIIYLLFQIIQKRKNIYYILYAITGMIAINTHFFETIFLFLNFIFALIYLRKRKKDVIKFVLTNFIILFSFIPFFIFVVFKKGILTSGFNSWLEDINISLIKRQIAFVFGGIISFILSVIFFIKTLFQNISFKRKMWLIYLFYVITFTIIISVVLSYLIKPMVVERYYSFLAPLFIAFLSLIMTSYKKRAYFAIFLIWIALIQYNTKIKDPRKYYRFEKSISTMLEDNKNNYIIVRSITKFYFLDKYKNINIITFSTKDKEKLQKDVQNEIKYIINKNRNAIIYTVLLNPGNNNPEAQYTCFYNKEADTCLWKITKK